MISIRVSSVSWSCPLTPVEITFIAFEAVSMTQCNAPKSESRHPLPLSLLGILFKISSAMFEIVRKPSIMGFGSMSTPLTHSWKPGVVPRSAIMRASFRACMSVASGVDDCVEDDDPGDGSTVGTPGGAVVGAGDVKGGIGPGRVDVGLGDDGRGAGLGETV